MTYFYVHAPSYSYSFPQVIQLVGLWLRVGPSASMEGHTDVRVCVVCVFTYRGQSASSQQVFVKPHSDRASDPGDRSPATLRVAWNVTGSLLASSSSEDSSVRVWRRTYAGGMCSPRREVLWRRVDQRDGGHQRDREPANVNVNCVVWCGV